MTVELVDGHAGSKHIESRDIAILHQGWRNIGNCVFPGYGGTPFQISFSGNSVQVGPGAGSIQGLDFYNDGTESLSIPNAASYGTRVVGAEYTNDGGIESVELKVYSSESEMPRSGSITSGSTVFAMPLWNVTGSSGSWSSSRRYSLLSLGGGGGAQNITGSFQMISNMWNVDYRAYASGGLVTLIVSAKSTGTWDASAWNSSPLFHYDVQYQNLFETNAPAVSNSSAGPHALEFYLVGNGISIRALESTKVSRGTWFQGSVSWPCA